MGLVGIAACGWPPETGAEVEIDRIEDGRAVVIERVSDAALTVATSSLPPGAREGDVVVDGRVDPALTAAAAERVRNSRARLLRSPLRSGDSLGSPPGGEPGNPH